MLYVRGLRLGIYIDLTLILDKCITLFNQISIFYILTLFLSLIILYMLFIHVKNYLLRSILKRHLHYYHNLLYKTLLNAYYENDMLPLTTISIKYPFYIFIIKKLSTIWSYDFLLDMFIYHNLVLPYCILKDTDKIPSWMNKPLKTFINYLPLLFLISFFFYECFCCNFVLHYIFYYLPFFIGYKLFINVTYFFSKTNDCLNRIIYERYYEKDNVLYVNTTLEEDKFILDYISNGFICFSHNITGNIEKDFDTIWAKKEAIKNFAPLFMERRRFVILKSNSSFFVNSLGYQINVNNLIILEVFPMDIIKDKDMNISYKAHIEEVD